MTNGANRAELIELVILIDIYVYIYSKANLLNIRECVLKECPRTC